MFQKKLPVGADLFDDLRKQNYYYVDKTNFIRDLLLNRGIVNLFTRPRRFGKTLTMTMLKAFFEVEADHQDIFSGLNIMKDQDLCTSYMNRYPVIFVSLKSVQGKTFQDAAARIASLVSYECDRLSFLADSPHITERDKRTFDAMLMQTVTQPQLEDSLKFLSRILKKHYGEKAIILVDEYDVPLDKAFDNGYYDDMIDFIRIFFGEAFKTNDALEFAVVTGCLRISKESIFTGVNNLMVNAITDSDYEEHFGFTDLEVQKILSDYNLSPAYEELRAWYNGYRFGDTDIYCPWDIIHHVARLKKNPGIRPKSYWNNTSSNNMVKQFINKADTTTRNEIEELISGKAVAKVLKDTLTYGDFRNTIDNLWSVLFLTGYLTRTPEPLGLESDPVQLIIPNLEVREIFLEKIRDWFTEELNDIQIREELQRLYHALLDKNCDVIEKILQDQLRTTISYFDNDEHYYHGFLAGLLIGSGWSLKSNRESGSGRSDLMLITSDGDMGIVIEVKHAKNQKDIPVMSDKALTQIEDKNYKDAFLGTTVKQVMLYGMIFWKKTCKVHLLDT
ncbi:MAG: ATP-binding protein [Peptococcaceae bacterium]|nr:ATP-binding protein [Peptococcaceae bacterium]